MTKTRRRLLLLLFSPLLLLVTVMGLLYVPPVQRWAIGLATDYAERQTGFDIGIEGLRIRFPLDIEMEGLCVVDPPRDTLVCVESAVVDLDLMRLPMGRIGVEGIELCRGYVDTHSLIQTTHVRGRIERLALKADELNLRKSHIKINNTEIDDCDIAVTITPSEEEDTTESQPAPWRIVADRLEKVHLLHAFHKYPGEISGGMKKRAALARAIALKPELLFCDEPSTGLDPVTARSLDELLLELRDTLKVSMVIVSHELESIKIICDRFVYLKEGFVHMDGTLQQGMESDDPTLKHFFSRQCPKETYSTGFYNFDFID